MFFFYNDFSNNCLSLNFKRHFVIVTHFVCCLVSLISMFLPSFSSFQSHYFTLLCKQPSFITRKVDISAGSTISKAFLTFRQVIWNSPYTIEDVPIWENTNVEVRCENIVKSSNLLVPKEEQDFVKLTIYFIFSPEKCVRHPHLLSISHCQVADFIWNNCVEITSLTVCWLWIKDWLLSWTN